MSALPGRRVRNFGEKEKDPAKDEAEMSDVVAAMELLKKRAPQDVAALKGVDLIRVASLGGTTAGEFSLGDVSPGGARKNAWLKLADRAFASNDVQFFGGGPSSPTVPSSFQVILHEVGHAVEKEELRKVKEDFDKASVAAAEAKQRREDFDKTYQAEFDAAKRAGKLAAFYKKREAGYKQHTEAQEKAAKQVTAEGANIEKTLAGAATEAAAKKTAVATELTAAKRQVQAMSAAEVQSSAAYLKAVEDTDAAITNFVADAKVGIKRIEDLEVPVQQKVSDRDRARKATPRAHKALPGGQC
jgi:hypothetical protein